MSLLFFDDFGIIILKEGFYIKNTKYVFLSLAALLLSACGGNGGNTSGGGKDNKFELIDPTDTTGGYSWNANALLKDNIENFLVKACSVLPETIKTIRNIMLEEAE